MKNTGKFLLIIIAFFFAGCDDQNIPSSILRFNEEGKFKIVQFTDTHFEYNTPQSDTVLTIIQTVINEEKPDLVVITGDVVCSKETREAWLQLTRAFVDAKVPWAITLGNHDHEYALSNREIIALIDTLPYCLTSNGPEDISGSGNYILPVLSAENESIAALLYFFDSNAYSFDKKVSTYDWIKFDQIAWYRAQSKAFTKQNNGNPYPALGFFHIPLPEYNDVRYDSITVGSNIEEPCPPTINSGFFNAMLEMKDIMGTFVGHDHDNNYIGCLHNICLAYGCKTGLNSYGDLEKGARVIVMQEGERKFDTWIRSIDKTPRLLVTYPLSFARKSANQ